MKSIIEKISFWFNCARVYSLPITILNWLVAFIYALKFGGNLFLGLLAFVGIALVHMATNLIDDYFDYKILCADNILLNSAQNCKCKYLKDNLATTKEVKSVIILFLSIAAMIGSILFFTSGVFVSVLAFIALFIAYFYQKFSLKGLGEIIVIFAYGPLLYEGVYYVMTSQFSFPLFWLSLACALFTNTILYAHMLMDYDGDKCAHKITLCSKFKNKDAALNFILFFYFTAFIFIIYLSFSVNIYYLLSFLVLPLIFDLFISLKKYNSDKNNIPKIYFWHYPLDNWNKIQNAKDRAFYFRFFYSRNILVYFLLLICFALLIK